MITYLEEIMIKQILKVFGMHLMCAIGALFILLLFPGVVSFRFGEILYSVFAFIIFFDVFYTLGWEYYHKKKKMIKIENNHLDEGDMPKKLSYKPMIIISCVCAVINIIIFVLSECLADLTLDLSVVLFRSWFSPFYVAYKYSVEHIKHICFIFTFFPSVAYIIGCICGVYNINVAESFVNKFVYKKPDKSK
jgi:hypothetical protein